MERREILVQLDQPDQLDTKATVVKVVLVAQAVLVATELSLIFLVLPEEEAVLVVLAVLVVTVDRAAMAVLEVMVVTAV